MHRIFPGLVSLVLILGSAGAAARAAESQESQSAPRLGDLKVEIRDGQIVASFRLSGALDAETRARIASGLETEFDFRVEIVRRRRLWVDGRVVQHRIATTVKYDSLSRQYGLTLRRDGEVERSSTTDRPEEMERWLTTLKEIPLGAASEFLPLEDFSVRVKADFPVRFVLFFIPWDQDTSWERAVLPAYPLSEHGRDR